MSNAPSLKEPSMEEILASIRRIIESGDERGASVLKTDILHAEPANESAEAPRAHLAVDTPPRWERAEPAREFDPANGDRLSGIELPHEDEAAHGDSAVQEAASMEAAAPSTDPSTPGAAVLPERAATRQASPDVDRHGLSLSGAYRREMTPPAPPPAADLGTVQDAPSAEPEAPAMPQLVAVPKADRRAPSAAATAPAETEVDAGFDEEQFTSDLRSAAGFDAAASAPATEPSVMVEASTLMSEAAGAQVAAAFDDLARSIRDGQMKSMEEMAREMLRPMLQEWLDDNLPRVVERMVREEIERVSRGPRR